MAYLDFIWNDDPGGNVRHVGDHGLLPEKAEYVVLNPQVEGASDSSGLPMRQGYLPDGRWVIVIFEWIDPITVYVRTAYERDQAHDATREAGHPPQAAHPRRARTLPEAGRRGHAAA